MERYYGIVFEWMGVKEILVDYKNSAEEFYHMMDLRLGLVHPEFVVLDAEGMRNLTRIIYKALGGVGVEMSLEDFDDVIDAVEDRGFMLMAQDYGCEDGDFTEISDDRKDSTFWPDCARDYNLQLWRNVNPRGEGCWDKIGFSVEDVMDVAGCTSEEAAAWIRLHREDILANFREHARNELKWFLSEGFPFKDEFPS